MNEKILCVDDEPKILNALQRQLDGQFDLSTAVGATEALEALASKGPFAVIVSDMRMPGMDGIRLLSEVRKRAPECVRIMLTGFAELQTAVEAVNEGNIFRFLTKPCRAETFAKALDAGITQYRLVMAEKELLEKTLSGSVKVLTDILSLVNPTAFGRASRVRRIVRKLATELKAEKLWAVDLAAMLSQIGCVTLPPGVMDKLYRGEPLTSDETKMFEAHPAIGQSLVAKIPRLDAVAEIIAAQDMRFDGQGSKTTPRKSKDIPIGARILKVALDFDTLTTAGLSGLDATLELRQRTGWYDPAVLAVLDAVRGSEEAYEVREVYMIDLTNQMILGEDVKMVSGMLVVCKGNEVTTSLRQRLQNYAHHASIHEPIRVLVKPERAPNPASTSPL